MLHVFNIMIKYQNLIAVVAFIISATTNVWDTVSHDFLVRGISSLSRISLPQTTEWLKQYSAD